MTRLNSQVTFFHKKIFPLLWFGIILTVYFSPLRPRGAQGATPYVFGLVPALAMAALGILLFRFLLKDLVDEVYDAGDALVVRNAGVEERIPLAVIRQVTHKWMVNPPRITLSILIPTKFGTEITFVPRTKPLEFLAKGRGIAEELKRRVEAAKR